MTTHTPNTIDETLPTFEKLAKLSPHTPKLRFPEFSDKWEVKKLGEITSKISDGLHSTPIYDEDGEYYFVNGNNLINGTIQFSENTKRVNYAEFIKHKKDLDNCTILISINGTIGSLALYNEEKIILGKSACYINIKHGTNKIFIYNSLQSSKIVNFFNSELTGSTIKNLSLTTIKNAEFSLPQLPEQTKIANFLTAIDEKIQALKQKKTLLEQYKKGIMQQIFSQELRFKNDNGDDFDDWEENNFSYYIKLYRGSSPRPINKYITKSERGVNWIKIGDMKSVKNYIIEQVSEKITVEGALHSRKVEIGELILANSMSFGKTYQLNISGCIYDGWFVLREYELHYEKNFLLQLLNSEYMQKQYKTLSTGGVVQNISSDIVYSTNLFKPCLSEQTKIANFLTAIDEKIEKVSQQITGTETYKKGLLQAMFC